MSDLAQPAGDGIYAIPLTPPITTAVNARLYVKIADRQGNLTRASQKFSVLSTLTSPLFLPSIFK